MNVRPACAIASASSSYLSVCRNLINAQYL
jgi:hypothetical protein